MQLLWISKIFHKIGDNEMLSWTVYKLYEIWILECKVENFSSIYILLLLHFINDWIFVNKPYGHGSLFSVTQLSQEIVLSNGKWKAAWGINWNCPYNSEKKFKTFPNSRLPWFPYDTQFKQAQLASLLFDIRTSE